MYLSVRVLGRKEIAQSSGVMCLVKGLVLKLRLELGNALGLSARASGCTARTAGAGEGMLPEGQRHHRTHAVAFSRGMQPSHGTLQG